MAKKFQDLNMLENKKVMKIKEYVKEYTSGRPIRFLRIFSEVKELLVEIFKFNKDGIKDEFGDVFHFVQLWFFWRFGLNGEVWGITKNSIQKFINRKKVWQEIYAQVGLPKNISNYVGNYKKIQKVVDQLRKFGVNQENAEKAYKRIVLRQ